MAHSVAIVGLGPKGFYCLERLLAEFKEKPLARPLQIHVFNRSPYFGSSPIYDPDQPEFILINISVADLDLWEVERPPIAAGRGLDFVNWYQQTFRPQRPLNGDEYHSRALVGRYLIDGFQHVLSHIPTRVTVSCHVAEVIDVEPSGEAYKLEFVTRTGRQEDVYVNKILLATGHSRLLPRPGEKVYQAFTRRHRDAVFIPFVYPVEKIMRQILVNARVAMQGIGLTFIDAALQLTEGRGGRFERSTDGELSYVPSGEEPKSIIPFSRSGLPMSPKAFDLPVHPRPRPLTFFTTHALSTLRAQAPTGQLDWERDLLPLFELEMDLRYYWVAMGACRERDLLESCGHDANSVRDIISAYLSAHPDQQPFDYHKVFDPVDENFLACGDQFARFVEQYMEQEIANARKGEVGCGVKAAIGTWYEIRKTLGSILPFRGLTPQSHKKLIEFYYPRLKRVAFGPPIINIEKLLALLKVGLLDFSVARNPQVLTNEATGCFEVRCVGLGARISQAEILVDARYPAVDITKDATPLYRNLLRRGMVRPFENRSVMSDGFAYCPGAIDMTEGSQFVVNAEGFANEDISVIGIPTEGNLAGTLKIARDDYSGIWAAGIINQFRCQELSTP